MPYSERSELPEHVRQMDEEHQTAWMKAWNAAYAEAEKDGKDEAAAEAYAMRVANAAMNKMHAGHLPGVLHVMRFAALIETIDDAPVWNKIAPITQGPRYRVRGIARAAKGKVGEVYEITRQMADEAVRNHAGVQRGDVPVLLIHPYERQERGERLGPEDFRRVGHIDEMRISADGTWLEGRYVFTDEGRALVRSGKFDRESPTVLFAAQDESGENVGCLIFEVSLVPVGEFREQPALAAGAFNQGVATMHCMIAGVDCTVCCSACATEIPCSMTAQGTNHCTIACGPCPACGKTQAMDTKPGIDAAAFSALQGEVGALKAQLVESNKTIIALAQADADAACEAFIASGRDARAVKITPATEPHWRKLFSIDATAARAFLAEAPVVKSFGASGHPGRGPASSSEAHGAATPVDASRAIDQQANVLVSEGKAKTYRQGVEMAMAASPELAEAFTADVIQPS